MRNTIHRLTMLALMSLASQQAALAAVPQGTEAAATSTWGT